MTNPTQRTRWTSWVAVVPIWVYQKTVSPLLGRNCRFMPSCSQYARESFARFGLFRGAILTIKRLGRCHPLGSSGYDPVPLSWES